MRPIPDSRMSRILPAIFLASLIPLAACALAAGTEWGEEVPASRAVLLSEILDSPRTASGTEVVVRGRIGEVCRSSGCWLVLQESVDGSFHEILVDLAPSAGFTVPQEVRGHTARVIGHLSGDAPDRRLIATGLALES